MLNIDADIRTLSTWLNEEQLCEIDRPALARVLGFYRVITESAEKNNYFTKRNIENYPLKDNCVGLTDGESALVKRLMVSHTS